MSGPLHRIESFDEHKVRVERTEAGWYYRAQVGLSGYVRGFNDGIICRLQPGSDPDVVQLGISAATSSLCNAIYSPSTDTALLFTADGLAISPLHRGTRFSAFTVACEGPLAVTVIEDYLRAHRNLPWYTPLNRRRFPRPPAGWCSWYFYYLNITEAEVVKNTDWLAEHLKPFGCEWVQIDDGWQGRGEDFGTNRDWFTTCERDFPQGMKWIAHYIRACGMRPGIWCIPFTQSDPELWEEFPNLFVRRDDGGSPGERSEPLPYDWMPESERMYEWAGRYVIDPTGAEGKEYLRRLFDMIIKEWGYDYVKIDAQAMMAGLYQQHRRQLADSSLDGERAYRGGLEVIKSVMGQNRFLLNCGLGMSSCGFCEGLRIGGDVELSWNGMLPSIDATMQHLYLNTIAFYTDPDVVCVREPLPYAQAQVWATLLAITGQLLMTSDKMYALPDERVALLQRIFPVADIHPMELYPLDCDHKPRIFDLKINKPGVGEWDVVAVFNWDSLDTRAIELSPERLGLPGGDYLCLDAWTGELLHEGNGTLALKLPPASCRVVAYWQADGCPSFIGTDRHLTMGAVDVEVASWDEKRDRLSGVVNLVPGHRCTLRFHIPPGFLVASKGVEQYGSIGELHITRPRGGKVRWRVDFVRE